jgi:hypothetical protein
MKKFSTNRTVLLIIGVLAILALAAVTARLVSLEFESAVPFSAVDDSGESNLQLERLDIPFYYLFYCAAAIFGTLTVFAFIVLPPKQRWKFLLTILLLLAAFLVTQYLFTMGQPAEGTPTPEFTRTPAGEYVDILATATPEPLPSEFVPPSVAPQFSYAVALALSLAAAVVTWILLARRKRQVPLEGLEEAAQAALDELQAGGDWAQTVEEAYLRMTEVVQQQRGLKRRVFATPAEFAVILENVGLPANAVRRLTALFERVRYGGKRSTKKDIGEAIACLTEIVAACQEARG